MHPSELMQRFSGYVQNGCVSLGQRTEKASFKHNYEYESMHSTIPLHWDDATHTLTIGNREGSFPGMPASHTFDIVFVGEGHGVGIAPTAQADEVVQYSGQQITVKP